MMAGWMWMVLLGFSFSNQAGAGIPGGTPNDPAEPVISSPPRQPEWAERLVTPEFPVAAEGRSGVELSPAEAMEKAEAEARAGLLRALEERLPRPGWPARLALRLRGRPPLEGLDPRPGRLQHVEKAGAYQGHDLFRARVGLRISAARLEELKKEWEEVCRRRGWEAFLLAGALAAAYVLVKLGQARLDLRTAGRHTAGIRWIARGAFLLAAASVFLLYRFL